MFEFVLVKALTTFAIRDGTRVVEEGFKAWIEPLDAQAAIAAKYAQELDRKEAETYSKLTIPEDVPVKSSKKAKVSPDAVLLD